MIRPNMRFCPELDSCADGVIRIATAHSASARGTFRQLSIEVCCKGRLYGFMRSCDSRKKHALHAASPSSNASTRCDSRWPKKPHLRGLLPIRHGAAKQRLGARRETFGYAARSHSHHEAPLQHSHWPSWMTKTQLCTAHNAVIQVPLQGDAGSCFWLRSSRRINFRPFHPRPKVLPPSHHPPLTSPSTPSFQP